MSFLSIPSWAVPAALQKRLVKFLLKRALGQFLQEDLEHNEELDIQLGNGQVVLRNVHLNSDVFNDLCQALPLRVQEGIIGSIQVSIPWSNLWSGNCEVKLDNLVLTCVVLDPKDSPFTTTTSSSTTSDDVHIMSSSLHFADDFLRKETTQHRDTGRLMESVLSSFHADTTSTSSTQGLKILTELIDKIISRVNIRFRNVTINLVRGQAAQPRAPTDCHVRINVDQVGYEDRENPDQFEPLVPPRSIPTQWFRKIIRIHGFRIELLYHGSNPKTCPDSVSQPVPSWSHQHTVLALGSAPCVLELDVERLLPFHVGGSPRDEFDASLRGLPEEPLEWRATWQIPPCLVVCSPWHLTLLGDLLALFQHHPTGSTTNKVTPGSPAWDNNQGSALFHSALEEIPIRDIISSPPLENSTSPTQGGDSELRSSITVNVRIQNVACVLLEDLEARWMPPHSSSLATDGSLPFLPEELGSQSGLQFNMGTFGLTFTAQRRTDPPGLFPAHVHAHWTALDCTLVAGPSAPQYRIFQSGPSAITTENEYPKVAPITRPTGVFHGRWGGPLGEFKGSVGLPPLTATLSTTRLVRYLEFIKHFTCISLSLSAATEPPLAAATVPSSPTAGAADPVQLLEELHYELSATPRRSRSSFTIEVPTFTLDVMPLEEDSSNSPTSQSRELPPLTFVWKALAFTTAGFPWHQKHSQYGGLLEATQFLSRGQLQWDSFVLTVGHYGTIIEQPPSDSVYRLETFTNLCVPPLAIPEPLSISPIFSLLDYLGPAWGNAQREWSLENDFPRYEFHKRRYMRTAPRLMCGHFPVTKVYLTPTPYTACLTLARHWSAWLAKTLGSPGFQANGPVGSTATELPIQRSLFLILGDMMQVQLGGDGDTLDEGSFAYNLTLSSWEVFTTQGIGSNWRTYVAVQADDFQAQECTDGGETPVLFPGRSDRSPAPCPPMFSLHGLVGGTDDTLPPQFMATIHWITLRLCWDMARFSETLTGFDQLRTPSPSEGTPSAVVPQWGVLFTNSCLEYPFVHQTRNAVLAVKQLWVITSPLSQRDTGSPFTVRYLVEGLTLLQRNNAAPKAERNTPVSERMRTMDCAQWLQWQGFIPLAYVDDLTTTTTQPWNVDIQLLRLTTCSDSLVSLRDLAQELNALVQASTSPPIQSDTPHQRTGDGEAESFSTHDTKSTVESPSSELMEALREASGVVESGPNQHAAEEVSSNRNIDSNVPQSLDLIEEYYSPDLAATEDVWDLEWVDRREVEELNVMFVADYPQHSDTHSATDTDFVVTLDPTSDEFVTGCSHLSPDSYPTIQFRNSEPSPTDGPDLILQSQYFAPPGTNDPSESPNNTEEETSGKTLRIQCRRLEWHLYSGRDGFGPPADDVISQRSSKPMVSVQMSGIDYRVSTFPETSLMARRFQLLVQDFEVIDLIPTSGWHKFLTHLRSGPHKQPRESDSQMLTVKVDQVRTSLHSTSALEYRVNVVLLPLRFYIDQDTLGFLIAYGLDVKERLERLDSPPLFTVPPIPGPIAQPPYFQSFRFDSLTMKVDYKPKQLGFPGLSEKHLGFVNLFPLQDAKLTLTTVEGFGLRGVPQVISTLCDEWVPHITHTQLPGMVGGVSPIRSLVTLGTGLADLIILPIEQYKRDGRVIKGLQRGARSFKRTTASETIKLGTKVTSTAQTLLETATDMLAGSSTTGGPVASSSASSSIPTQPRSRFADQPRNLQEGMSQAYRSLTRNFGEATETILAIPVEIYEQSGRDSMQSVLKAVPIAILKPMIGTSEALSKTLLGLRNTIDPSQLAYMEDKYKSKRAPQ
ncbi:autophagy- protein 2 [Dispira simplex]|nr:autophagy- protein 2 [Dispira simplex]